MDFIQYVFIFVIVVCIGLSVAAFLQYRLPTHDIDNIINNDNKMFELMQIRHKANTFTEDQNDIRDYTKLRLKISIERENNNYLNSIENRIIQLSQESDNHKFSLMAMQMSLEERKQTIINDCKQIDNNYDLEMMRISQIDLLQKELKQIELDGIKAQVDGEKSKALFEHEKYTQEQQRTIREQELHVLHKAMEALTSKSEFMSRFGESFKEKREKEKLEEYLNQMKEESDNIFSQFDIL